MTTKSRLSVEDVLAKVQSVATVIEAHRDQAEMDRKLPEAVVRAMMDAGLFNLWVPAEYGGDEVDIATFLAAIEEVARLDAAAGWTLGNLGTGPSTATFLPPEGAGEVFGDGSPRAVAGTIRPTGKAIPAEGGYMVSGRWSLVSGCHFPDWIGLAAFAFEGDAPRMVAEGVPDLRLMLVRQRDVQILDTWYSLGMRGTGSTDIAVQNLFVPEHRTFSYFIAQPQIGGPLYKAGLLALFSMSLSTVLLGIARRAIDTFVELASSKVPTLSQTTLASRPTVHAEVAHIEALVLSARSFLYASANEVMDALKADGTIPDDMEARRRLACVNVADSCREAVDRIYTLAGTSPIYSGHSLEQCLRDIHTAGQHLVVSPVWWEKTGQFYFGQGLGMP